MTTALQPIALAPNRPTPRPYRGGAAIERFRRLPASGDAWAPEDFLASTVTTFGSAVEGLSVFGGVSLRERIADDPVGYLGEAHVAAFGADPKLLCKLLHTGERLFVHVHPDGEYADRVLGLAHGKTEAWIVLAVDRDTEGRAWLGFREDVDASVLSEWYATQNSAAMLSAMNEVPLRAGDVLYVPAGLPHSIGEGVLILELQEPADLSVILEYAPFERVEPENGLLGLDVDTALEAVDRRALNGDALTTYVERVPEHGAGYLLPPESRAFFRAEWIPVAPASEVKLSPSFAVIVVVAGVGQLTWDGGTRSLIAGDTVLVPYGTGEARLSGDLTVVRCMPPEPRA